MPRASWRGFLRLSLVTCPVYLSPATTGTKPIRLRQVWQPAPVEVNEDALPDRSAGQQGSASSAPQLAADHTNPAAPAQIVGFEQMAEEAHRRLIGH